MIHIPPEVQAAAGIPAAQALQCSFSGFCHAIRREHFAQAQLVRGQLFVAEHAVGMTEDCAVFRAECVKKLLQFFRFFYQFSLSERRKSEIDYRSRTGYNKPIT